MSDEVRSIPPIEPVLDPKKDYVEINSYVVFWGLFYAAVFTLAVGYLCLKIGQTVDAFAPVSVLAVLLASSLHLECNRCIICTNGDSYHSWRRFRCFIMRYVPSLFR